MIDRALRRPTRSSLATLAAIGLALTLTVPSPVVAPAGRAGPIPPEATPDRSDADVSPADGPLSADLAVAAAAEPADPADDPDAPPEDDAGLAPTVQFEEATRHAADRITFTPGGRVTVGFTPRTGDPWTVGDDGSKALPAGRLDGKQLRAQGRAPVVAIRAGGPRRPAPAGSDRGAGPTSPSSPLTADPASFVVPGTDPEGTTGVDARVSPDGLRKEVFGFLPYWEIGTSSLRLDYAKISTIAYFGVGVDVKGNLQKRNPDGSTAVGWSGWTSSRLTSIIQAAHKAHTRVVLTVQSFGWTSTGLARQKALLTSSSARLTLARQIAAAVRDRGADGVNLDIEPLAKGAEAGFTALVRSIRAELNKIHRGYQVTFDTTGSIGNYPIEAATAPGGADAIFIMGYDYRTASSSPVGSVAPYSKAGYDIVDTVKAYAARVPATKLILGVPYYGRAWSTKNNLVHASNASGPRLGASTSVTYDTAADYLAQHGRRYDAVEGVAWTAYKRQNCTATYGCVTGWRELYVDDAAALLQKYALINAYGLRGAGIWALGYDGSRPELYAAIQRAFINDTTPPVAAITVLPARQPNPEFSVSWTGRDDVGVVSYDVQRATDGGPWTAWLTKTTLARATFDGDDGHAYAFRVRARDRKGNTSAWNVASRAAGPTPLGLGSFAVVRMDGLSVRSAADTSAPKLGTLSSSDLVALVSGRRTADGYIWYRISGPLTEWAAFRPRFIDKWVAAGTASARYLAPATPPNATTVRAILGDLTFGGGGAASVGPAAGAVAARAFSPNGDGSRDGLALSWTNGVALDSLALKVYRADGRAVGTIPLGNRVVGPQRATWNGLVGKTRLTDGRYVVSLVGAVGASRFYNPILAWRSSALAVYGVTVDTVAPKVTAASIGGALISPNGDGVLDAVRATIRGTGATTWAFGVAPVVGPTVGKPILIRSGGGRSATVSWNGLAADGKAVPDGTYRLSLALLDAAGNHVSRTWTVRVDRTAPTLAVSGPAWTSPNGDGAADTARLSWTASERIRGTVRIYRGTSVIRSWTVSTRSSGAITWNGTTSAGKTVPDGVYTIRVAGRDAAGNPASATRTITVDRTLSTLRWGTSPFFPQDGDALAARSTISVRLSRAAVVTGAIYAGDTIVRTFWARSSAGAGRHTWTWNGRNASGAWVAPGRYVVRVTATTALGTTILTRSVLVDAFDVRLSASTLRAGRTLTVTFRTVEPLRTTPAVTFSQPGRSAVRKTATPLGSGRYRVWFVAAKGPAGPATIRISARDSGGRINATSRFVTIR